jgi:SpoVK/Ycf46/Vps4 family AAA+-type ATPase
MANKYIGLFSLFVLYNQQLIAEIEKLKLPTHGEFIIDHESNIAAKKKAQQINLPEISSEEKVLFEESFSQAPSLIKTLVTAILKKKAWATHCKNILLTGPSGSGKTTLAQAMAHKLNRKCLLVHGPTLLGHYKDQAAENIRALFQELETYSEKPILVIDEVNALTDDHTSEHSDTKHTAMQFWTLLDKYKNDKDFFFIGTTNVTKKMPHQLQSRFKGKTFLIDQPSCEARKRSIKFYMQKFGSEVDATCNDQYLTELAKKTTNFSQRDIETLIELAHLLYDNENTHASTKISKKYLEQAYLRIIDEDEKFWDFTTQTTDEERRHKETLAQSEKQFKESQETQIKIAEMNYYIKQNYKTA